MNPVSEFLASLRPAPAQQAGQLVMVPLLRAGPGGLRYVTLAEALADGGLRISEISESGSVPEVRVHNDGKLPVLLLDGEALIGAKQNRVLNLSVMVPAHSTLLIPVSCVEAGRWSHRSAEFAAGDAVHFAGARAAKFASVSASMDAAGSRRSDQGRIWRDMESYCAALDARAPSMAMQDVFESVRQPIEDIVRAMQRQPEQCGAAFIVAERLLGLDVVSSPAAYATLHDKLVRSYAVDARIRETDPRRTEGDGLDPLDAMRLLLAQIGEVHWNVHPAVGLGQDLRTRSRELDAGALAVDDEVVHLVAFPKTAAERREDQAEPRWAPMPHRRSF